MERRYIPLNGTEEDTNFIVFLPAKYRLLKFSFSPELKSM